MGRKWDTELGVAGVGREGAGLSSIGGGWEGMERFPQSPALGASLCLRLVSQARVHPRERLESL